MLQDILNFIKENYKWLLILLGLIVEAIFVVIFKKKPVRFYAGVFEHLVPIINEAEFKFPGSGRGKEKKDYVLSKFFEEYPDMKFFGGEDISYTIEYLLSLPVKKKKGGN